MQTIEDFYREALKKATGREEFEYDPEQLNCLFHPTVHEPVWGEEKLSDEGQKKALTKDAHAVLEDVLAGKRAGRKAYILLAPAFLGQYHDVKTGQIRNAFRKMGFDGLVEVALFADILTLKEALEFDRNIQSESDYMLTSCCCPMWVAMIKKSFRHLMPHVPPSVSPMIAAGRTVKKLYPDALTVFLGPCMAKKTEAKDPDLVGAIDHVLTFQECKDIFDRLGIQPQDQSDKKRVYSSEAGRIYAYAGGVSQAVQMTLDRLNPERAIKVRSRHANGVAECKQMLNDLMEGEVKANFFEGMGCAGGCVGGPKKLIPQEEAKEHVKAYGKRSPYRTPLDNPYVLELLTRLGFYTLEGLLYDETFFSRKRFA